ncbi:MAG TPA: AMP-binding protein [Steroidobacteraceae bacterium]|nr:AMP-binding protein [Steroidobacteraceae bacterium]
MTHSEEFMACRDQLLRLRADWAGACREFHWPRFSHFNWVGDYFDVMAAGNQRPALRVVNDAGGEQRRSFAELAQRSQQVAAYFAAHGLSRGDRLLLMLPNCVPLWEALLAAIRMGLVIIPASTLLERADLADRIGRGAVRGILAEGVLAERFAGLDGAPVRIATGGGAPGWLPYEASHEAPARFSAAHTRADEVLFLYFTSGTTARPKLVAHSHVSYPVGHLTTMYALGLQPGDVHLNLSSPGWAKHAWSCFFAPWNAAATVLAYDYQRFDAAALLTQLVRHQVTTLCAPPTVWRMLIQQDLAAWPVRLREATSAGEPLNPEVMARVQAAWGITLRDVYGQTETSAQVGNPPGQPVKAGSMGRPLPGCPVVLLNAAGEIAAEGELCIDLAQQPLGLMQGYLDDPARSAAAMGDGFYHSGDVAARDAAGYLSYVGRSDDVFKSSDYRISPFELESVLIEHVAVAEAAVVPSPDALRLSVPKAFVVLTADARADAATAASILAHVRRRVAPYQRIRRLEFAPLPKTISGKIRRAELRALELARPPLPARRPQEFWEEDLPGETR